MNDELNFEDGRLSRIETLWSVVNQAHLSDAEVAVAAQHQLLDRYGGAIRRYLLGAVKNRDLADELFQEFAVKFVRGDFKSADPSKGRFRSFVKTILFRMVALHFRKQSNAKVKPVGDVPEPPSDPESVTFEDDELFVKSWRDDLLASTWEALSNSELSGGAPHHTVLQLRVQNPAADSNELAALVGEALGKDVSSGNARVMVHRARDRFARRLIEKIAASLGDGTLESVEAELIELKLIDYCRDTLQAMNEAEKK